MCPECFISEYPKFETGQEFDSFISEFNSRKSLIKVNHIGEETGKPVFKFFGISFFGDTLKPGYDIFQCQVCGEKWKLSEPENAWRGFFLRLEPGAL